MSLSYGSKNTPVGPKDVEEIANVVLLYVFIIALTASLFTMNIAQYIIQAKCKLSTAHYTLHTVYCRLHTANCTLYTKQCTEYIW